MNKTLKHSLCAIMLSLSVGMLGSQAMANESGKAFTAQLKTSYTTQEILVLLKKEGYQAKLAEGNTDRIMLTVNGEKFMLRNDYQGDLQFVDFYKNKEEFSLSKVNKFSQDIRYGKLYRLDDRTEMAVNYLLPAEAGLSEKQILQGVKDFLHLLREVDKAFGY